MGARHHMEGHWRHLAAPPLQQQAAPQQQQHPPQASDDAARGPPADDAAQPAGEAEQQHPQLWVAAGQPQLTLGQRFTAAAGASLVSALVVNPLDVVKVSGFTSRNLDGTPLDHACCLWNPCCFRRLAT